MVQERRDEARREKLFGAAVDVRTALRSDLFSCALEGERRMRADCCAAKHNVVINSISSLQTGAEVLCHLIMQVALVIVSDPCYWSKILSPPARQTFLC